MFASAKSPSRRSKLHWQARALSTAAIALGGLILAAPTPATADMSHAGCLWAGASFHQGDTVWAGGWAFTCDMNESGAPQWVHNAAETHFDTVLSPGTGNPYGQFSPGALQPGTDYNDYCVGSQLIEGPDDLYELDPAGGALRWRSFGPISRWKFSTPAARPTSTWRSSSMCIDGVLS
ncbi:hypothetical protein [Nocardia sp. CDC160]|uniref:hypothetical protein n=1 Tax=Nocardia sp. CDC160 TaxID=3112166 RepID=UPI002DBC8812|nr:hypothetical protein [Nocardia sp. CDC160]MEC3920322.1 hypothetical protein [Nocardia sp. CDC160]